jgi:uncharacterized protein YjgD (DUF1641 family)
MTLATLDLDVLNEKLDRLTAQVAYLTEQAELAERSRRERDELLHDAMPIANGLMQKATAELQDIEDYVEIDDLVRVVKKLARHLPDIEMLLDQLDGVNDLLQIAGPISKDAFNKAEGVMDHAERKGYFKFAAGGLKIVDNIVTSFTEDEVQQLGDNIVLILRTVKDMTQPEVMNFVRNTVSVAEEDVPVDTSYRALVGQMRDPNVRRGLAQAMRVLSSIGAQSKN